MQMVPMLNILLLRGAHYYIEEHISISAWSGKAYFNPHKFISNLIYRVPSLNAGRGVLLLIRSIEHGI